MQLDRTTLESHLGLRGAQLLLQQVTLLQRDVLPVYMDHVALLLQLQRGLIALGEWWATALASVSWRPAENHLAAQALLLEQQRRESNLRELRYRAAYGNELLLDLTTPAQTSGAMQQLDTDHDATVARVFGDTDRNPAVLPDDLARLNHFFRQKTQRLTDQVLPKYRDSILLNLMKPLWESKESLQAARRRPEYADVPSQWLDLRLSLWQKWEAHLSDASLELIIPPIDTAPDYRLHETVDDNVPPTAAGGDDVARITAVRLPGLRWPKHDLLLAHAKILIAENNDRHPSSFFNHSPAPLLGPPPTPPAMRRPPPSVPVPSPPTPAAAPASPHPAPPASAPLIVQSASAEPPLPYPHGLAAASPQSSQWHPSMPGHPMESPPDSLSVEDAPPYLPPSFSAPVDPQRQSWLAESATPQSQPHPGGASLAPPDDQPPKDRTERRDDRREPRR